MRNGPPQKGGPFLLVQELLGTPELVVHCHYFIDRSSPQRLESRAVCSQTFEMGSDHSVAELTSLVVNFNRGTEYQSTDDAAACS